MGEYFEIPKDVRARVTCASIVDAASIPRRRGSEEYKGKVAFVVTGDVENTGGFDFYPSSAISKVYGFDDNGHLIMGEITGPRNTVAPGQASSIQAEVASYIYSFDLVKSGWVVFCLSSNPANPQATKSEKCEIYQVNK